MGACLSHATKPTKPTEPKRNLIRNLDGSIGLAPVQKPKPTNKIVQTTRDALGNTLVKFEDGSISLK